MKRVTGRDVALLADVSQSTVSRVFNHHQNIGNDVRRRVIDCARRLHYDGITRESQGGIGVVVRDPGHLAQAYYSSLLGAVSLELSRRRYRMELVWPGEWAAFDARAVRGGVDLSDMPGLAAKWSNEFNLPLVRVGSSAERQPGVYSVLFDGLASGRMAVGYLRRLGHREIYYLSLEDKETERRRASRRWQGFMTAMAEGGIADPEAYTVFCRESDLLEEFRRIFAQGCTALVCPNDALAIRVDPALRELGMEIPRDVSVIDWDFTQVSEFLAPPRTAITIDFANMAKAAVDVLEQLFHRQTVPETVRVAPLLIERRSVGPAPAEQKRQSRWRCLTRQQRRIVDVLRAGPAASSEIARRLEILKNNGQFRKNLAVLRELGVIAFDRPDCASDRRQQLYLLDKII